MVAVNCLRASQVCSTGVLQRLLTNQQCCWWQGDAAASAFCLLCVQLTKWFTWFVLVAFLASAVFWVTRLNKVGSDVCRTLLLGQP